MNWATKLNAELPRRPVASLLFANCKAMLKPSWHWTNEKRNASYAWDCDFLSGSIDDFTSKSYEGSAVAVRLIPIGETK
jgi:hypothetical protein